MTRVVFWRALMLLGGALAFCLWPVVRGLAWAAQRLANAVDRAEMEWLLAVTHLHIERKKRGGA